jgi:hypothetical protein
MEPFPGKSKKFGRLAFRLTVGTVFDVAFHSFVRSFFLLFPALFLIDPPMKYPELFVVLLFLALTLFGYVFFRRSSHLTKFRAVEVEKAREILKETHGGDWMIVKNNKQLFYAEKWQGRLRHYFFVIFDKKATYLSSIYNYPLPIAGRFEKAKLNELGRLLEKACNKNKH